MKKKIVEEMPLEDWETAVKDANRNCCSNCGGVDHLKVKMIVPEEVGGRRVLPNGTLLCWSCDVAADSAIKKADGKAGRPVNLWVSRPMHERVKNYNGFTSISSLVRYLISKYIAEEDRFDDLEQYQDSGRDIKLNVWVDSKQYEIFKCLVDKRGVTITDSIKSLLTMYGDKVEPVFKDGGRK